MIEEIMSFCHECSGIHYLDRNTGTETWYCPNLEVVATRRVGDRWLMQQLALPEVREAVRKMKMEGAGIRPFTCDDFLKMGKVGRS